MVGSANNKWSSEHDHTKKVFIDGGFHLHAHYITKRNVR